LVAFIKRVKCRLLVCGLPQGGDVHLDGGVIRGLCHLPLQLVPVLAHLTELLGVLAATPPEDAAPRTALTAMHVTKPRDVVICQPD
jgi:hypothetical protein